VKSRPASSALLALVALVHYGYDPLAAYLYPGVENAPRALFYVLRGFEGAVLWLAVLVLARKSWPLVVACVWGFFEGAQTAVCRLALGIGSKPETPSPYSGLCELVSGMPVVAISAVVALVAVAIIQEKQNVKRG
jgi:hypothetical protein